MPDLEDSIELLSHEGGHAIAGTKYPRDRGVVVWLDTDDRERLAYRDALAYPHKFFKRDEHGRPIEGTLVEFLVPDDLCDGPNPSTFALELVAERMGWT